MEKIKDFVKGHIREVSEIGALILGLIILAIIFFNYPISLTWDSTEYIGLADLIGKDEMRTNWIGHRGIGFPLLIKFSQIFGKNPISLLLLMFTFYTIMICSIFFMYKKIKKLGYLKNIFLALFFAGYVFIVVAINPELLGYYHTALTEFVGMTIAILMCVLTWNWKDYNWKENKKEIIINSVVFAFAIVLLYHTKQSLVVFALIPLAIATVISVFNDFSFSNIVCKIATIAFVGIALIFSIDLWGKYMTFSKFGILQILKYILLLAVVIGLFALVSLFEMKFANKYKLEKNISKVLKYGLLVVFLLIGIIGYNYYKYDEKPIYAVDLTYEQQKEYLDIYYEKFAEMEKEFLSTHKRNEATELQEQGIDVISISNSARVEGQLIYGALPNIVAFESNFAEFTAEREGVSPIVPRVAISYKDNFRIDKILNGYEEEGYSFNVYRLRSNDRYFVYFFNINISNFINQLNCYLELLVNYPEEIFASYKENFFKMIYVREGEFSPYDRENYNIPSKIYLTGIRNVVDSNPEYELGAGNYIYDIKENFVNKNLNWYMNKAIFVLLYKTETALWYMPIVLIIILAIYIILRVFFNKKISNEKLKLLELILILFGTAFGGMMSYIVFGMNIERYAIPSVIPALLAYFLLALFILDFVIVFVKSTHKKLKQKLYNKVT